MRVDSSGVAASQASGRTQRTTPVRSRMCFLAAVGTTGRHQSGRQCKQAGLAGTWLDRGKRKSSKVTSLQLIRTRIWALLPPMTTRRRRRCSTKCRTSKTRSSRSSRRSIKCLTTQQQLHRFNRSKTKNRLLSPRKQQPSLRAPALWSTAP